MSWTLLLALPAACAVSLAFRGFRDRVTGGRFETRDEGAAAVIQTELGSYRFDGSAGKIHLRRPDGATSFIKLGDVRGVQIRVGYKQAMIEEFFLEGWSLADLHRDYRDHRMHWDVLLTTCHGAVPLARLTQYKKRDWFDLATPLQHAILGWCGLYRDGADAAADLEDATRRALRRAGLNVRGGYDVVSPQGALEDAPMPTDADLPRRAAPTSSPPALAVELPPPPDNPRWTDASGREGHDRATRRPGRSARRSRD